MPIKKGDKVKIDYTGTLEDGTVFDSSEKHNEPLEFEAGADQMIKGFDDAVIGMKKGEEKEITLQPSEAYGDLNPQLLQKVPRDKMPEGDLQPGMMIMVGLQNNQQVHARIAIVTDDNVTIDLNHPLAGKVLNFKIKVVDVS